MMAQQSGQFLESPRNAMSSSGTDALLDTARLQRLEEMLAQVLLNQSHGAPPHAKA
jgi:hypothetical protein